MAAPTAPPPQMTTRFTLASVQAVEPHGAAGHDLVLGVGRQALHALAHHVRRAREEAVAMRIVGRPEDLVRTDIVGERAERAFDRLEGDPAIAPEDVARPHRQPRIVEALVVEVAVHAVEPRRDPAAARFEESNPELGMALADAAPDHAHR